MTIYIITGIIAIIIILVLIFITKYNHIKDIIHKIDTSKKNISSLSGKQVNIFNKASKRLKEEYDIELPLIGNKNLNEDYDFELDKNLKDIQAKFDKIIDEQSKVAKDQKIIDIKEELTDTSEDIIGLKDYYNRNVSLLNKLLDRPFYSLICKIFKIKKREKFDIRKITELEILKN